MADPAPENLTLRELSVKLPDFELGMKGAIKPADTKMGMQGHGELTLSGLSGISKLVREHEDADPRLKIAVTLLPFFAALGETVTTEDGRNQVRFSFALDETGALKLNGQDIGGLFGSDKEKEDAS